MRESKESETEVEWVQKAQAGDLEAFESLVSLYERKIYNIARRLLEKGEGIAADPVEMHDVYQVMIVVNYRDRQKSPEFLQAAISACQRQIANAPEAIRDWQKWRAGVVPTHNGFEQLAIIHEKEGDYHEAIRLSKEAMKQGWGWKAQWERRIERCE